MGELLRQGFDAQLADRNTKGYDLLVGFEDQRALQKVQVKTVRNAPWYVNLKDFSGELLDSITIYVLLGRLGGAGAVRFFIARNRDVATQIHRPPNWKAHGFINLKALKSFENRWDLVKAVVPSPRKRGEGTRRTATEG